MRSVGEIWSVEVPEGALESGLHRGCTYVVKWWLRLRRYRLDLEVVVRVAAESMAMSA